MKSIINHLKKMKTVFALIFFFQIVLSEKPFLNLNKPFKPFISVFSPETLKKVEENDNKEETKLIQEKSDEIKLYELKEDDKSIAEEKLRNITFSVKCMFVDDFNVYDIRSLGINKFKTGQTAYNYSFGDNTIFYNFCYDLKEVEGCSEKKKQIFAKIPEGSGKKCVALADSINKGNKWSIMKNTTDNTTNLQIELNSIFENQKVYYKLRCKEKAEREFNKSLSYFNKSFDDGIYRTVLFFETEAACTKFDFYKIWEFINKYNYIFAIILIAFGLFNCILGQRFSQYTSFILTLFVVTVLSIFLFQFILPSGCADWIIWVILIIGVILGCTAGYFVFIYHEKFMAFLVGGIGGFLLGEFCFNLFGGLIKANPTLINILFIVICIIACVILAYFIQDIIIIIATSFIGSYTLIRGISLFAGHFPSEFTVIDLKAQGEDEQLRKLFTWRVYVYLVSIVIACGLSIYIQILIRKATKESKEETPDDNLEGKLND